MALLPTLAHADSRVSLWEVRGDKATVYLYGSIHMCRASCYPLPASVLRRFDAAPTLAVELDPYRPEVQWGLQQAGTLPAGQRLADLLDAEDAARLDALLAELNLPATAFASMQPWMAGTMIGLVAAQRAGLRVERGIDLWLVDRARRQGKPVAELETVERQIASVQAGGIDEQVAGLRMVMDQWRLHRLGPYFDELVQAWQVGDAARVDALLREAGGSDERWRAALLDERNKEMSLKIADWLEAGRPTFVVVGVGHLAGAGSLVELLAGRGYAVRQLGAND
ncbi:MAG: TraB/GumN family protein [Rhodocyclaceae bacterium]